MQYKIFGCKVNKYYLNLWLDYFNKTGDYIQDSVIIATCVVTDRAKTKWLKEIINHIKDGKHVYITGCGSIDKGKLFEDSIFFDIYKELLPYKNSITLLAEKPESKGLKADEHIYTKKFVVIQTGCDTHCSFCLTVLKRGKSQSLTEDEIISQINDFEKQGGKEIVLTGINLAAYGSTNTRLPKTSKFNELLKAILKRTKIERIRISSLGPEFLNDEFFEILCDTRFLPHFHFSIQSFSDKILKSMNRNYDSKTLDYVLSKTKNLNRPDQDIISIGADLIIGFPGEEKEDFEQTMEGVRKYAINKLHVFPFSAHTKYESIPASDMENQVNKSEIKLREKEIINLGNQIRQKFIKKNIGKRYNIMIEGKKNGLQSGWTGNYIQVALEGEYKKGEIIEIKLDEKNIIF